MDFTQKPLKKRPVVETVEASQEDQPQDLSLKRKREEPDEPHPAKRVEAPTPIHPHPPHHFGSASPTMVMPTVPRFVHPQLSPSSNNFPQIGPFTPNRYPQFPFASPIPRLGYGVNLSTLPPQIPFPSSPEVSSPFGHPADQQNLEHFYNMMYQTQLPKPSSAFSFVPSYSSLVSEVIPMSPSSVSSASTSDEVQMSSPRSTFSEDSGVGVETNSDDEIDVLAIDNEESVNCSKCNKVFSSHIDLAKHHQLCSPINKIYTCTQCQKEYTSTGALKMHIKTHTLPCKCEICGKSFSRPWLLQGHIRTHTGEKPFNCTECDRRFADRSNLRAHYQTHTEVKKYPCKNCTKTFSRMSLLNKHTESACTGSKQFHQLRSLPLEPQRIPASASSVVPSTQSNAISIVPVNMLNQRSFN